MKCFIGIEKKLEDDTMFYREPVQIDSNSNLSGSRILFVNCSTCTIRYDLLISSTLNRLTRMADIQNYNTRSVHPSTWRVKRYCACQRNILNSLSTAVI